MSQHRQIGHSRNIAELFNHAQRHHQAGELAAAEGLCRSILAHDPRHADGLHLLGLIALQVGRGDLAAGLIDQAIGLRPKSAIYRFNFATALIGLNRYAEAQASLRKAIKLDAGLAEAHNNLANLLIQTGRLTEAVECLRIAVRTRPDYAEAHSNLGGALLLLQHNEEAVASFETALSLRPDMAELHYNLGDALNKLDRVDDAENCCREAVRLKPDYFDAWNLLGIVCAYRKRFAEAEVAFQKGAQLRPGHSRVRINRGKMLLRLNRHEEIVLLLQEALRLDPNDPEAHTILAMTFLELGRYREAWPEYEWRWKDLRSNLRPRNFGRPMWTGDALSGRTLLLHAEQGFGDSLQLVRYTALVPKDGKVIVEIQPSLARLAATLEGVDQVLVRGETLPDFDLHCPLFSLPLAFGTTIDTIPSNVPYLSADPIAVDKWRMRLAGTSGPRVGLVWAGQRGSSDDETRSMSLESFAPLAEVGGTTFVSLQKGEAAAEAAQPPVGMRLLDWTSELQDFADTAALVGALDLVIGVDTAVSHLAGALGHPVWLLNRCHAEWRWRCDPVHSPWYPTLRQFRQPEPGNWDAVIHDVRDALKQWPSPERPPHGPAVST
jgi:tetratricopeptide (TPR) repeat protein